MSADETFAEPNNIRARQAAGTVHVHPNGRFVYGAWSRSNGSSATTRSSSKEQHARALMRPDAHPMEMSGRLMEGYVAINPPPKEDRVLREWLELAVAFAKTLPTKPPKSRAQRAAAT